MTKKRRFLWIFLFAVVAIILGSLATGWNVVLVRDYYQFSLLARGLSLNEEVAKGSTTLVIKMILGTLGFIAALILTILLFIKLLREMRQNQLQSEFLAAVSHELKTPIAVIQLSSSLIRCGGLSDHEVQNLWHTHEQELKRLKEEVDKLLEAAHWHAHSPRLEMNRIHLDSWISSSVERWKKILGPDASLTFVGDKLDFEASLELRNLNLIVDNLLNNAKKFSKGPPQVTLYTEHKNAKWKIEVRDLGLGFHPSDSKKIFNRFFRAKVSTPFPIPGTGLGLFLAQTASRAMGLKLRGDSPGPGLGAIFTIEGSVARSPKGITKGLENELPV